MPAPVAWVEERHGRSSLRFPVRGPLPGSARWPGLPSTRTSSSGALAFPAGGQERGGLLSRDRPGRAGSIRGPGALQQVPAVPDRGQAVSPPRPRRLPATMPPVRGSAARAEVLGVAGHAGTCSPPPPQATRSPRREDSNPQAASRGQKCAEPAIPRGPGHLGSALRPPPTTNPGLAL